MSTIKMNANLEPLEDNMFDLGSSNKKWNALYLKKDSLYLGGIHIVATANGDFGI